MTTPNSLFRVKPVPFLIILFYVGVAVLILVFVLKAGTPVNKKVTVKADNPKKNIVEVNAPTAEEKETMNKIQETVVPKDGFKFSVKWGNTGKKLVENGAIDLEKFRKNYMDEKYKDDMTYLTEEKNDGITVNADNAYFWVNTLWALGLNQQSLVLEDMKKNYPRDLGNLASTGGWTLGAKPALELYGKETIIPLTVVQQETVKKISAGIYRPCCNNSTAFPDCNHGMAALGLVELMVSQNFSEEEIYRAVLAFNSYWFSQTYVDLAYYFQKNNNTTWADVDSKQVLSSEYSSAAGYKAIKAKIGNTPGVGGAGAACGA
ncbi:MAG: hypothetical protein Q7S57_04900 [bacterium]|nr:hypothetical protein [bacterium]